MNIAIFAGCGSCNFNERLGYIRKSFQHAVQIGINYILLVGGKMDEYSVLTQAEIHKRIISDHLSLNDFHPKPKIVVFPCGKTIVEDLTAVMEWIEGRHFDLLLLCTEQSQAVDFYTNALKAGLLDLNSGIMIYGHLFPKSKNNLRKIKEEILKRRGWFQKVKRLFFKEKKWSREREILRNIK